MRWLSRESFVLGQVLLLMAGTLVLAYQLEFATGANNVILVCIAGVLLLAAFVPSPVGRSSRISSVILDGADLIGRACLALLSVLLATALVARIPFL
jgi:hypothetical protein